MNSTLCVSDPGLVPIHGAEYPIAAPADRIATRIPWRSAAEGLRFWRFWWSGIFRELRFPSADPRLRRLSHCIFPFDNPEKVFKILVSNPLTGDTEKAEKEMGAEGGQKPEPPNQKKAKNKKQNASEKRR